MRKPDPNQKLLFTGPAPRPVWPQQGNPLFETRDRVPLERAAAEARQAGEPEPPVGYPAGSIKHVHHNNGVDARQLAVDLAEDYPDSLTLTAG